MRRANPMHNHDGPTPGPEGGHQCRQPPARHPLGTHHRRSPWIFVLFASELRSPMCLWTLDVDLGTRDSAKAGYTCDTQTTRICNGGTCGKHTNYK